MLKFSILFFVIFLGFVPLNGYAKGSAISVAENAIKDSLNDPDSAKFKNLKVSKVCSGSQYVLGYVNAKNSYGGYTGFKIFHVKVTGSKAEKLQANGLLYVTDAELDEANNCEDPGHPLVHMPRPY